MDVCDFRDTTYGPKRSSKIALNFARLFNFARLYVGCKWLSSLSAVAFLCGILVFATGPNSLRAQGVALVRVDVSLVGKGLRANKLIGRSVINDQGETIGKIDDIVITEDQKLYVPLQVGGFLGIGSHLVVIPYDSLHFDETERKILLPGASREELKKMAEFKYIGP
jgi:sporulation protein YlmC with PRC-barrel domain